MERQKTKFIKRRYPCNFPDELLIEIFKWLPAKSIVQLLCICKSWYSLITSTIFISAYTAHQQNTTTKTFQLFGHGGKFFVFKDSNDKFHKQFEFSFKPNVKQTFSLVGYCDGVFCMLGSPCGDIILWNPSIRKTLTLTMPIIGRKNLVFGFGFDSLHREYKLVRVAYFAGNRSGSTTHISADIYMVNKGNWKIVDACLPFSFHVPAKNGVYVNGVIHWMLMLPNQSYSILTFSLDDEKFGYMALPRGAATTGWSDVTLTSVNLSRDMLALAQHEQVSCLWVMKEYGMMETWVKLFAIDFGNLHQPGRILCARRNGEIVVATWDSQLLLCDPVGEKKKKLGIRDEWLHSLDYVGIYVESMVLLKQRPY